MKKFYIIVALLLVSSGIFAQLNEGFEGSTFPPTGWTVINGGDAKTWVRDTTNVNAPPHSGVAQAAIHYSSTAHADYLITPKLAISAGNNTLTAWFRSWSGDTYPEPYDVMVSTTGTATSDFTVLVAATDPDTAWVQRTYDLSAYNGQNIYVAFRSTTTDKDALFIDDVVGPTIVAINNDMGVSSIAVPTGIVYAGNVTLKAFLINNGAQPQVAGKVVTFYNGNTILGTATTTAAIAPGAVDSIIYTWTNAPAGNFIVKAEVVADDNNGNNFATANLTIYPAGVVIESFEGITALPPTGWTNPETWALGTNPVNAYEGTQYAYVPAPVAPATIVNAKLITPKLEVVVGDSITFMAYSLATTANPTIKVQYSSTTTGPWTDVTAATFTMTGAYVKYKANITVAGNYYFAFTCANSSTSSARMDLVIMPKLASNAINETISENSNFSIYPNPVKNELNITSVASLKNVKIINAIGQEIMNENVIGNHYKVNTSSYNKGVYFVQIESEKGKTTKKFVVNE